MATDASEIGLTMPDTIAGWRSVSDRLLSHQCCAFHRNVEISSRYVWTYRQLPACFKWAAMAAIASHHIRLALVPLRLDTDRAGYVDIPRSLGRRRVLMTEDVNVIRATNNAIFDDIFWVHLGYLTADDGIELLRALLRADAHYATILAGFEAIDRGRRLLDEASSSAEARQAANDLIWAGNLQLLEHEQRAVVQPSFDRLSCAFARIVSIGAVTKFEVRGVRQEIAYSTSFYLDALTSGIPHALRARDWPRITRFDDRWRWLETSVVPRFRRLTPTCAWSTRACDASSTKAVTTRPNPVSSRPRGPGSATAIDPLPTAKLASARARDPRRRAAVGWAHLAERRQRVAATRDPGRYLSVSIGTKERRPGESMSVDLLQGPGSVAPIARDPEPPVAPAERAATAIIVGAPFAAVVFSVVWFWGRGVYLRDVLLAVALFFVIGHGITIGFHRMLAHRSFVACRPLKLALLALGSMAFQGGPIGWVADHRRHHVFSDLPDDPHSPHRYGRGPGRQLRGLWHSQVGWLFTHRRTSWSRHAADLLVDRDVVRVNALFPLWCVVSLVLPFGLGWLLGGGFGAALTALLWAGGVRIFFLHHVTWSINSLCHTFGRRPFHTADRSTNLAAAAVLTMGESWHNGHHAFPRSARHGLLAGQWDSSALLIRGFERVGWARDVHQPKPDAVRRKLRNASQGGEVRERQSPSTL